MARELTRTKDVTDSIRHAIARGLEAGGRIVKNYAVANVTGRVLKRASGDLARSIYARVRKTRSGATLRVGTKVFYGRLWEFGFIRGGGRSRMAPRPWLRPAAEQALPRVAELIDLEVDRQLKSAFGDVTIEIKLT